MGQSLKLGRYAGTTLGALLALVALYMWLQAILSWGASTWASAMAWSVLAVVCFGVVMVIESVENRGD